MRPALVLIGIGCAPVAEPAEPQSRPSPPAERAPAVAAASDREPESCPHDGGPDALRLPYEAFGPAAMSFELLGQAWWQWDSEGHAFDEAGGVVWVVVHDGLDATSLAARFPVSESTKCDHRYVELPAARTYLLTHIAELATGELPQLRDRLVQTQQTIDAHFKTEAVASP